ncbi:MAG: alpha/beta hydrolase, partial [Pseudomonadota bacterium]
SLAPPGHNLSMTTNPPPVTYPGMAAPIFETVLGVPLALYPFGAADAKTPPVILIHGWPEIAYSWRKQCAHLSKAGFHGFAIDLPGFGNSGALATVTDYDLVGLTSRLAALCNQCNIAKAIFCGHDWGGPIAWGMGVLQAEKVAGIIGLCTPHLPTPPVEPLTILKKRFGPNHYIVRFQEPGTPEASFEGKEDAFFRFMFRKPVPRALWPRLVPDIYDLQTRFANRKDIPDADLVMTPNDLEVYAHAYRRSGFTGGINLYRNINRNWETMRTRSLTLECPALWVGADLDLFLPPEAAVKMMDLCSDLERHILADCGHWITWQAADELDHLMASWLTRRFVDAH